MSGIAEAASIVGIVGVAGQTIQSASALYSFCKTYRHVESDLGRISNDVERLNVILVQLERLLTNLSAAAHTETSIRAAEYQIHACKNDLADWRQKIEGLGLKDAKAAKKIKEKLKIAADKGFFTSIHARICSHSEQLTLVVAILGA